jgi:hypothetical protein
MSCPALIFSEPAAATGLAPLSAQLSSKWNTAGTKDSSRPARHVLAGPLENVPQGRLRAAA